jgi:hypothetical protein
MACLKVLGVLAVLAAEAGAARADEVLADAVVDCAKVAAGSEGMSKCPWKPYFSVGPSISALSFNLKSKRIGLFDQNAAIELHLSLRQRWVIKSYREDPQSTEQKKEVHKLSLWELGLGVQVRKDQASGDVTFGGYFIPWGIRVDAFSIGVGVSYVTVGTLGHSLDRWSIIVPLTYQLSVG